MQSTGDRPFSRQGGVYRCRVCDVEQPLGSAGDVARHGWPHCCGYRMRWVTAVEVTRQRDSLLAAEPAWSRLRTA